MQDIRPIRVFLEVANRLSFVRAAEALATTPATVTRTVARLEEELGTQLLVRTTRQVALTSAGATVAARFRPLIAALDAAREEFRHAAHPHRGRLRVNAPMSFGQRVMPALAQRLRAAYPEMELTLRMTDRLVDIVAEECDLAIRLSAPPTDRSTIWRKLCEAPRRLVAAPGFLDRHGRPAAPETLDPAHCLSYAHDGGAEAWTLARGPARRTVAAGTRLVCDNGDLLHALVCAGEGIALLPDFIAGADLKAGRLEAVLPDWRVAPIWLSLYYPPYAVLPPLVAAFAETFEAYLAETDGFEA